MIAALARKGFRRRDTHHIVLQLYVDGRRTEIRTHFSHGEREYGDLLLGKVRSQLCRDKATFDALKDCPLDGGGYVTHLRENGILTSSPHHS